MAMDWRERRVDFDIDVFTVAITLLLYKSIVVVLISICSTGALSQELQPPASLYLCHLFSYEQF